MLESVHPVVPLLSFSWVSAVDPSWQVNMPSVTSRTSHSVSPTWACSTYNTNISYRGNDGASRSQTPVDLGKILRFVPSDIIYYINSRIHFLLLCCMYLFDVNNPFFIISNNLKISIFKKNPHIQRSFNREIVNEFKFI